MFNKFAHKHTKNVWKGLHEKRCFEILPTNGKWNDYIRLVLIVYMEIYTYIQNFLFLLIYINVYYINLSIYKHEY